MRRLQIYTSLWSMMPHDPSGVTLPLPEICERVAQAGYHGMALDLGAGDETLARSALPHMQTHGLTPLIVAFPRSVAALEDTLLMARDFGAPFVIVVGQVMPVTIDEMVPVLAAWQEMSERIGVPVQFETHRNCITNDLFTTLQLIERLPDIRLCADLSHYVVDREFKPPLSPTEQGYIKTILHRSDSFQGRVASRQQIQLQLDFPQHQPWVTLFKDWWRLGLADWRARNTAGDCVFTCELGPPEYAMTDAEGREMSNRWSEALQIKDWVEVMWAEMGGDT